MSASLNIYNSIEDVEPIKTYTCYRLTMDLDEKLNAILEETNEIQDEVNKKVAILNKNSSKEEFNRVKKAVQPLKEKLSQLTLDTIRLFFPNFTIDEFNKLDPYEYQTFIFEVGEMREKIYNRASKN